MAKIDPNNITVSTQKRVESSVSGLFVDAVKLISDTFGGGIRDVIVKRLFDRNDSLINTIVSTDVPTFSGGKVEVDPEADMVEFGFSSGTFKITYNFWRILVGDDGKSGTFIKEISPTRTEVRLVPTAGNEDDFNKFANARLTDTELDRMLDIIFNPPDDALPYNGFDAELIVNGLDEAFKQEVFRFDRGSNNSPIDVDTYLADILTNKIDRIVSNTRQSVFERIRLEGLVDQDDLRSILTEEFKTNIRSEFE